MKVLKMSAQNQNHENANTSTLYISPKSIGIRNLPTSILRSRIFNGRDIGQFSKLRHLPRKTDVIAFASRTQLRKNQDEQYYHRKAKSLILVHKIDEAIKTALVAEFSD